MATMGIYVAFAILVALAIAVSVVYSAIHCSLHTHKIIIILSFFLFLGVSIHPGDKE